MVYGMPFGLGGRLVMWVVPQWFNRDDNLSMVGQAHQKTVVAHGFKRVGDFHAERRGYYFGNQISHTFFPLSVGDGNFSLDEKQALSCLYVNKYTTGYYLRANN